MVSSASWNTSSIVGIEVFTVFYKILVIRTHKYYYKDTFIFA